MQGQKVQKQVKKVLIHNKIHFMLQKIQRQQRQKAAAAECQAILKLRQQGEIVDDGSKKQQTVKVQQSNIIDNEIQDKANDRENTKKKSVPLWGPRSSKPLQNDKDDDEKQQFDVQNEQEQNK